MFADRAKIFIRSGKGGDGHCSFRRELYVPNGGPDGGDGGKGGDLIFEVDEGLNTLVDYRHKRKYAAGDGEQGGKRRCHGKDGRTWESAFCDLYHAGSEICPAWTAGPRTGSIYGAESHC